MISALKELTPQIALLALLFAIFGLYAVQFHAFAADEYTYMNNARAFATGNIEKASDPGRFPGFSFVLSLAYNVLGDHENTGRVLNVLLTFLTSTAILLFLYSIEKNKQLALAGALLFAANPLTMFLTSRTFSEPLFMLLFFASLWALFLAEKNKKWFLALGPLTAAAVLTRFFGLYIILIGAIYLWHKSKFLSALKNKWFYAGVVASLVVFVPWLAFNAAASGSATQNIFDFVKSQVEGNLALVSGDTTGLGLPDKIPSYLAVLPFLLAAPMALVLMYFTSKDFLEKVKQSWKSYVVQLMAISTAVVFIVMELNGFTNPRLLRYAAVAMPALAVLFSIAVMRLALQNELWRKILLGAIFVNLTIGIGLVGFFGTYEKHVAFHEAGLYARNNCASFQSNFDYVLLYYTSQRNSDDPQCFVLNNYDGLTDSPPPRYAEVFRHGKIAVYMK